MTETKPRLERRNKFLYLGPIPVGAGVGYILNDQWRYIVPDRYNQGQVIYGAPTSLDEAMRQCAEVMQGIFASLGIAADLP